MAGRLQTALGPQELRLSGRIAAGEIVVLSGESGCGKSTLLRALAGLPTRFRGPVAWGDEDWSDARGRVRVPTNARGLGLPLQHNALFTRMCCRQQLSFVAGPAPHIQAFLERAGLELLADVPLARLSGGQQQRLGLARALECRPWLMLLDEPSSALDGPMRQRITAWVAELHEAWGFSGLIISHDPREWAGSATRHWSIEGGRLVDRPFGAVGSTPAATRPRIGLGESAFGVRAAGWPPV